MRGSALLTAPNANEKRSIYVLVEKCQDGAGAGVFMGQSEPNRSSQSLKYHWSQVRSPHSRWFKRWIILSLLVFWIARLPFGGSEQSGLGTGVAWTE